MIIKMIMNLKTSLLKVFSGFLAVMMLASCSTTEKVTIHAKPGTRIYSPDRPDNVFATIPDNGKVELKLPSDAYYGYFIAQEPGQQLLVPFGLDYKNTSISGSQSAKYLGIGLAGVGITACLTGGIALAAQGDDDDMSTTLAIVAGAGGGMALVGTGILGPAEARSRQLSYEYAFTYQRDQQAIQDLPLVALRRQDSPKNGGESSGGKTLRPRAKATSGQTPSSSEEPPKGSTAKRRSDYAKNISGTYRGSGTLSRRSITEEEYSDVEIVLERVDKNHVKVIFRESGEEFFESPDIYEVTRKNNGTYELVVPGLPSATISIAKNGRMTYQHKSVILDDTTFTLKATATRR